MTGKPARSRAILFLFVCLAWNPLVTGWGHGMACAASTKKVVEETESRPAKRAKPEPGIYHRLEKGQTLSTLSRAYRIPVATLLTVNQITDPDSIPAGTPIFIPGARRTLPIQEDHASWLAWPLRGRIMTRYNIRGGGRHHDGIDIDGELGQPIRAAADGRVLEAGREGRYGKAILIDHGHDWATFYAHASELLVQADDWVEQGEVIALVGRSGNARGTHLHFEVRRGGRPVNPLVVLPDPTVVASTQR
jgi:LysM repeat protein